MKVYTYLELQYQPFSVKKELCELLDLPCLGDDFQDLQHFYSQPMTVELMKMFVFKYTGDVFKKPIVTQNPGPNGAAFFLFPNRLHKNGMEFVMPYEKTNLDAFIYDCKRLEFEIEWGKQQ